jgi:hypothetical protein
VWYYSSRVVLFWSISKHIAGEHSDDDKPKTKKAKREGGDGAEGQGSEGEEEAEDEEEDMMEMLGFNGFGSTKVRGCVTRQVEFDL